MRDFWYQINHFLSRYLSPAVRWIVLANVVLFLLYTLLSPFSDALRFLFYLLMETPALALGRGFLWQLVSYMFMHATFTHLLFNMLALWFFAPRLEYRWGTAKFLRFYFITGVGAGLFHALVSYLTGHSMDTMLGALGAVYGVMLAYAWYYPDDTVLLYFVIPIKIRYLMIFLFLIAFFSSFGGVASGISHITHLGGLLVALIYLLKDRRGGFGGGFPRRRARILKVDPSRHPDYR
jgi:membrane associated rhomboid family serine protease